MTRFLLSFPCASTSPLGADVAFGWCCAYDRTREERRDLGSFPRRRSEGIVTEELGDELLAYCASTQTAHALSHDAASVWRECDGRTSTADIARRVGLDETTVTRALEELSDVQLIDERDGLSRREASKRVAKLGAVALSAPLIYSVAVPPVSAAVSLCSSGCPNGAVIPCGANTCQATPGQFSGPNAAACSSGFCYRGATNNTCYCTASSSSCSPVNSPCQASSECCAGPCVLGLCQQ